MGTCEKIIVRCQTLSRQDGGKVWPADWRLEYKLPSGASVSHQINYSGQSPMGADLVAALGAVADDILVSDWSAIPIFDFYGNRLNQSMIGVDCGMRYA